MKIPLMSLVKVPETKNDCSYQSYDSYFGKGYNQSISDVKSLNKSTDIVVEIDRERLAATIHKSNIFKACEHIGFFTNLETNLISQTIADAIIADPSLISIKAVD